MDANQYPPEYLAEDSSRQLINVAIAFALLETIFLTFFTFARRINSTTNGLDFWLIPAAYLACFSHVIIISLFVKYGGAGRHVITVTSGERVTWSKLTFAELFLYLFSTMLPKMAILCLYLRIFVIKLYRYAVYGIAVIMVLNWLTGCLMGLLMCKPVAYSWNKSIPGGYCGDIMAAYRWASLPNLITDIAMLLLPLPVIWNLHTHRSQKIGLTLTFITGSVGIITSAIRFATFFTIDVFSDPTYYVVTSMTWTCIEPGVYFIAATLPSLRPLARQVSRIIDFSTLYSRCVRVGYTVFSISRTAIAKDENSQSTSRSSDQKGFSKLKPREARIVEPGVQGGKTDYTGSVRQGTPRISGQAESFELV